MPIERSPGGLEAFASTHNGGHLQVRSAVRGRSLLAQRIFIAYMILLQIYYISLRTVSTSLFDESLVVIMFIWGFKAYILSERLQKSFILFGVYSGITLAGNLVYRYGGVPQPLAAFVDLVLDLKPFIIEAGFVYLFMKSRNPRGEMEAMCFFIIILAMLNSIFVLRDLASNGVSVLDRSLTFRNGFYQPVGLQLNQVRSAALTMLGATFAIYFAITRRSLFAQAAALYLGALVFAHQSAKELAAFLLILPFFVADRSNPNSRLTVWAFGLLGLGLITFATPIGSFFFERISFFTGDSGLDKTRTQLLVRGFAIAQDHFPLGTGAGTFGSAPSFQLGYSEVYYQYGFNKIYGATREYPVFLQDAFWGKIIGQSGFIGLIAYVGLIVVALTPPFILNRRLKSIAAVPACATCLLALLTSTASSPFSDDFVGVVTAAFAGFSLAATVQIGSRQGPERSGARLRQSLQRYPKP